MSEVPAERDPLEVLAEAFLARFRAGERPPLSEYSQRYPELAEKIRELFPALVAIEIMGPAARGPSRPAGGEPQPSEGATGQGSPSPLSRSGDSGG